MHKLGTITYERILVLMSAVIVCCGIAGCNRNEPMPIYTISGFVTDARSGMALAQAEVAIVRDSMQATDAISAGNGFYRLYPSEFGETVVVCEKAGFLSDTGRITVTIGREEYQLNFRLTPVSDR